MQLSSDTKRFLVRLSAFTVGLVLCVRHFPTISRWLSGAFSTLSPFIVGACLAFVLSVPMRLFGRILSRRNKKGTPLLPPHVCRPVSLVLAVLLLLLLITLFIVIVVPELAGTVSSLASSVMHFVPTAQGWISELMIWLEDYPEIRAAVAPYIPDVNQLASTFISFVQKYAGIAASTAVSQASSIFSSATDVIISFVFAVYVLLQKESLSRQGRKLLYAFLPKSFCDSTLRVASLAHKTFFSYVTIQCTEALILGGLCFAGMLIFRFPYAMVISVIMVFCALIPIYGAIISCILGAFLVLFENPSQALWFVVFILVLQQIETNLIYPRVVSTSINLPSMWVLLAVTVGGGLFGIVGMITAVPITSITYTLLGQATRKRLIERNLPPDDPTSAGT
ncbi:MAG: AI-2E family transporter [Clostridia bacterium]|nr:AI-2E family transporter [Clostridia bacterium]